MQNEAEDDKGAVFVHAAGFIGGHKTQAGALRMALKSIEMAGL
jgi:uncharacterized UPF0160 family protein